MKEQASEGRYTTLDGMRGVAALAVALYHYGLISTQFAPAGYLAVDFFFALSGFVIALNYTERLSGLLAPREFIIRRLIRLYPTYLAGHILGILRNAVMLLGGSAGAVRGGDFLAATVFGLVMLPIPYGPGYLFPLNNPAWSLFLELLVNIAFAFWLFRATNLRLVMVMICSAVVLAIGIDAPLNFNQGFSWSTFGVGLARVCFSFPLGILVFRHVSGAGRSHTYLALLPVIALTSMLLVEFDEAVTVIWELTCVMVLFPSLLAIGIKLETPRLIAPVFTFLGAISYPVYAIHGPMIYVLAGVSKKAGLDDTVATALFMISVIIASWIVMRFFDEPVRAFINSRRRARRQLVHESRNDHA